MRPSRGAKTMRAAVIVEPRRVRLEEVPLPQPGSRQVRVRLEGCGVCGSNLPAWEGRSWFHYPLSQGAPGHEGWGIVDAAGNEVERLAVGDRVAFLSSNAFAEYDLAEEAHAVKLPETLAKRPFPGKPLGCAMGILRRADLGAGQTLAVIGIGFLGALVTRLAVLAGARVIAISRRSSALELARQLGASHCLPLGDPQQIIREVEQLTGNALCDRVIEVTGAQRALDLAGELTRVRGRLIIAGYHHGLRQINLQLWNWRGLDVINAHERDPLVYVKNMRLALEATQAGQLELELLLTHRFPLERLDAAFQAMEERPDGFLKALVMSWS